jgi:Cellulase (glycosyl hydrolase family 5)
VCRKLRLVLPVLVVLLALPAATAKAVARMPVGFFDDPSFRWSTQTSQNLLSAQRTHSSIIHVLANWSTIAPTKPKNALNGNDPAYHLSDLDSVVSQAQQYGFEVLMTIAQTPKWANGGKTPNYPPTNMSTLTQFAQMLATRYNGSKAGVGIVRRFSVWNEPNLGLFLAPQFNASGKIVSPATYAKLFAAAYQGIKKGNPSAMVAAGETSNRGRNRPTGSVGNDSVAPATFAHLLSEANPSLKFDAWATHPYPSAPTGPNQKVAYPNVAFSTIDRFGADLAKWFHRPVPIWVTEYGEQTRPEQSNRLLSVSYSEQAADIKTAFQLSQQSPYVQMFVWFIFRDSSPQTWFSGVLRKNGTKKPSYSAFTSAALDVVGHSQTVASGKTFKVVMPVPVMAYYNPTGTKVGLTWAVKQGKKNLAIAQPLLPIQKGGTITIPVNFKPLKDQSYTMTVKVNDKHGHTEATVIALLPSSPSSG